MDADRSIKDNKEDTALNIAINRGDPEIIELLVLSI